LLLKARLVADGGGRMCASRFEAGLLLRGQTTALTFSNLSIKISQINAQIDTI